MLDNLLRNGQPIEIAQVLLLLAGMGFALMGPFVWVFGKTLALNATPDRRALWTASAAYAGVSLVFIFGTGTLMSPWLGPLVPLPGALAVYFWLRHIYRRAWIPDDKVSGTVKLENSDWRIGLGVVVLSVTAAAIKVSLFR